MAVSLEEVWIPLRVAHEMLRIAHGKRERAREQHTHNSGPQTTTETYEFHEPSREYHRRIQCTAEKSGSKRDACVRVRARVCLSICLSLSV